MDANSAIAQNMPKLLNNDCSGIIDVHVDTLPLRDEVASRITTKPQMRRLLQAQIKKNLIVACSLSVLAGMTFKVFVADVRKQKYAEFYRTYDGEKEFEVMRKKDLFQSC